MLNCFVTGASGFIGANLVHQLAARGHHVRALLRPGSDRRGLQGAPYEVIDGALDDRAALMAGLRGCDWCFHCAASYHLWLRDYRPMYAANVEGTRLVHVPGKHALKPEHEPIVQDRARPIARSAQRARLGG